ncbi:pyridoxal phosphate-dependent aminotransferase [Alkalibacter saccharofermentans]|uniref:Aromatic-amino-acid transaminase n=1 Tax=Alkalibacter saccharofermentans DSM 14828 TaxID=1120975 RepID=A0A1M4YYK8_9FIRM|nr:aminotransferase class I/II-fold pyridoxal phosphate-dependent enzyme [Alkalibacter saccharofermentans]SHF10582.1 aromatic-amino-acid transaminase [Alkalibacter saccharofermentans DSM 14828]
MTNFSMAANHSIRPVKEDVIFGMSLKAEEAIKRDGFKNIINSTIGALLDDEGKLVTFHSVFEVLKGLSDQQIAAYAPLSGMPEYIKCAIEATFMDCRPEGFIDGVATPGGSGAIRHAIWNYTDAGDKILTSNWFWEPYQTMASEHMRKIATYELYDENMDFNLKSFETSLSELLSEQKRALILLNTPAHNPTGYSLSSSEWLRLREVLVKLSKDENNKIVLFIDVAYLDFCEDEEREFFKILGGLPKNVLILVSFSMSKGYTFYGLRSGALIGVSSEEKVIKEFKEVCAHSNRGVWSNGTRAAMETLIEIYRNETVKEKVMAERKIHKEILKQRAEAFIDSASKVGLDLCPYKGGFFISIPHDDSIKIAEKLVEKNVFVVPLEKGLRFAVCAVSIDKCKTAPLLIKEMMDSLK